jgi:hypothetical protein
VKWEEVLYREGQRVILDANEFHRLFPEIETTPKVLGYCATITENCWYDSPNVEISIHGIEGRVVVDAGYIIHEDLISGNFDSGTPV